MNQSSSMKRKFGTSASISLLQRTIIPARMDYLGCRLELLDVTTGARKIIHEANGRFEAPRLDARWKKSFVQPGRWHL
ncbi:MAG: hypothetical protein WDO15_07600 [Bacteroidota bacterium]